MVIPHQWQDRFHNARMFWGYGSEDGGRQNFTRHLTFALSHAWCTSSPVQPGEGWAGDIFRVEAFVVTPPHQGGLKSG